jgi:hypothetical protein
MKACVYVQSLNHIHIMFIKLGSPTDAAKCLLFSHKQTLYEKAAAILNMADEVRNVAR